MVVRFGSFGGPENLEKRWSKKHFFCRSFMNWSINHSISGYRHCIDDLWSMGSFQYLSIAGGFPSLGFAPWEFLDSFGYLLASTTPGSIRKEMPEIPIFWGSEAIGYAPTWDDNFAPNGSEWVDECWWLGDGKFLWAPWVPMAGMNVLRGLFGAVGTMEQWHNLHFQVPDLAHFCHPHS